MYTRYSMFIGLSVIAWLFVSYQTYKTKARKRVGYADQSRAASAMYGRRTTRNTLYN